MALQERAAAGARPTSGGTPVVQQLRCAELTRSLRSATKEAQVEILQTRVSIALLHTQQAG